MCSIHLSCYYDVLSSHSLLSGVHENIAVGVRRHISLPAETSHVSSNHLLGEKVLFLLTAAHI